MAVFDPYHEDVEGLDRHGDQAELDQWADDGGRKSERRSSSTARGGALSRVRYGILDQGNGETRMKFIDVLVAVLIVVGALNWGLVGLFGYDLVAALLGDATVPTRLVYVVVGVAGLFQALQWKAIHHRWVGH